MNRMSFALTTPQFRARTKDVTRRLGWLTLKAGDIVMAIEKGMGLKKGEKHVQLGRIQIVSVIREPLDKLRTRPNETAREGFPDMTPDEFIAFFCKTHKGCRPQTTITRIEFEYLDSCFKYHDL
ncbi:hypothetical protein [Verrucomicrobium spinosum]|uniref:hypothetical protein n=1 Tax=Verrucomicrobium spinosum TaxID=2736 RepID=UPI0004924A19|nr:hypothetical protein [Verrucomicrobium spinosum]